MNHGSCGGGQARFFFPSCLLNLGDHERGNFAAAWHHPAIASGESEELRVEHSEAKGRTAWSEFPLWRRRWRLLRSMACAREQRARASCAASSASVPKKHIQKHQTSIRKTPSLTRQNHAFFNFVIIFKSALTYIYVKCIHICVCGCSIETQTRVQINGHT